MRQCHDRSRAEVDSVVVAVAADPEAEAGAEPNDNGLEGNWERLAFGVGVPSITLDGHVNATFA